MPPTQEEACRGLREQLTTPGNVVFVLGTGVSVSASKGAPTASWLGLLRHGVAHCRSLGLSPSETWDEHECKLREAERDPHAAGDVLIDVAEAIYGDLTARGEYADWLNRTVGSLHLSDTRWIRAVQRLGVGLATTNYDSLIEQAITNDSFITWRDEVDTIRRVLLNEQASVFHLHGHYRDPASVVFGHGTYGEILSSAAAQEMLSVLTLGKVLVFLGYGSGLDDPNFRNLRATLTKLHAGRVLPHYRLTLDADVEKVQAQHVDDSFVVIGYGAHYESLPGFLRRLSMSPPRRRRKTVTVGLPECGRPLVGRDSMVSEAVVRLRDRRDVAIVGGLPGVGKTAIAAALARDSRVKRAYPDGVLWVGLGQRPDPMTKLMTWARPLGVPAGRTGRGDTPGEQLEATRRRIAESLARRRFLLVIDDAWCLEDALVFRLGTGDCAHVLTTRSLRLAGQFTHDEPLRVAELDNAGSMTLLQRVAPSAVHVQGADIEAVLPSVTGGLPISVLLVGQQLRIAALRGRPFLSESIARLQNISTRLQLLEQRGDVRVSDDLLRPQWCLSQLLAMSEALLGEDAKRALRDLAILPPKGNTFSLAAAEGVSGLNSEAIGDLVDAGLLDAISLGCDKHIRFQMHQAVSDYARQRRAGDGVAYSRLADYFADLVEHPPRPGPERAVWLDNLELELKNLEVAYDWALDHQPVTALRVCAGLGLFWYERSRFAEGTRWNRRLLEDDALPASLQPGPAKLVAKVINDLGNYAFNQGDLNAARSYYDDSFARRRRLPGCPDAAGSLNNLSLIRRLQGDFRSARRLLLTALRLNRAAHRRGEVGQARKWTGINLNNLGLVALAEGDLRAAQDYEEQSLRVFEELQDDWGVAMAAGDLGFVLLDQGRHEEARGLFIRSLRLRRRIDDGRGLSTALRGVAFGDVLVTEQRSAFREYLAALHLSVDLGDVAGTAEGLFGLGALPLADNGEQAELLVRTALTYTTAQHVLPGMIARAALEIVGVSADGGSPPGKAARGREGDASTVLSTAQVLVARHGVDAGDEIDRLLTPGS